MIQTFLKEMSQKTPFTHIPHIKCIVEEATGGVGKFYENLMKCPAIDKFMKNPTNLNLDSMKEYVDGYSQVYQDIQNKMKEQMDIVISYWTYHIPGFSFDMKSFNLSPKTEDEKVAVGEIKIEPVMAKKETTVKQAVKTESKVTELKKEAPVKTASKISKPSAVAKTAIEKATVAKKVAAAKKEIVKKEPVAKVATKTTPKVNAVKTVVKPIVAKKTVTTKPEAKKAVTKKTTKTTSKKEA